MKNLLELIAPFRKSIIPVLVGAILLGLAKVGIAETMTVGEAVSYIVTGALVWLIPNRK